ncbi:MAG: hypothetical protein ACRCVX_15190 [Shewanella sp.]
MNYVFWLVVVPVGFSLFVVALGVWHGYLRDWALPKLRALAEVKV